jgi:environmental stress-induced protein Ves
MLSSGLCPALGKDGLGIVRASCRERSIVFAASTEPYVMSRNNITAQLLDPSSYRPSPWKNGGGVTLDITGEFCAGAEWGSWSRTIWRLGRTCIERAGPFSNLSGFDRILSVIDGHGLLLKPQHAPVLDVRAPMRPVRFPGEWVIESELEAGPVGVLNLIADRTRVDIDHFFASGPAVVAVRADTIVVYAPDGPAEVVLDGETLKLPPDGALRADLPLSIPLEIQSGHVAVASINMKA